MFASRAEAVAERLDAAWRARTPIAPITEAEGMTDTGLAYAIQSAWSLLRKGRGEIVVGRKIGLTNPVIQAQLGVNEPDYGALWQSSHYPTRDGVAIIPVRDFLQPRIEGEIAFRIGKRLEGGGITAEQVIDATDACALAIEIVDSRIADWRIKLADTIADNASYGGFALGPWDAAMRHADLPALAMTIHQNGILAGEGLGAAALGSPALSTAWLANKLAEFGESLEPGDIVISGALTKMLPVAAGDVFVVSLTGQPDLAVRFT
ncbi:MAG: 2-keto-4-pentenoate hydratase [Sandarakinorhabdus sp.]|jgi:2-keto-4-pentenoate hydratase